MIGIIGAMQSEIKRLVEKLENGKEKRISGIPFYEGKLAGKEVVLAACGVGKVFAGMCAEAMILKYKPKIILHTGVAGSTSAVLPVGGIALAESLVQHDMDTSPLGDPKGLISGINIVNIPVDTALREEVAAVISALGYPVASGIIATGDRFIATKEEKLKLQAEFGSIACEMEGGAIAQVCFVNQTPLCVIRSISDSLTGDGAMEYPAFLELAAERACEIILGYLKK